MNPKTNLKVQLTATVEALGFENWREGRIAETLLDDLASVLESFDENMYLLTGLSENYFVGVFIHYEPEHQPRVQLVSKQPYLSNAIMSFLRGLPTEDKLRVIQALANDITDGMKSA